VLVWKGPQGNFTKGDPYNNAKNIITGTDGTRSWVFYDHNFDPNVFLTGGNNDPALVTFNINLVGGVGPSEIDFYDVTSDSLSAARSPGTFDIDQIADAKAYVGHAPAPFRYMDLLDVITAAKRVWTASDIGDGLEVGFGSKGWSYDRCMAFSEAVGTGAHMNLPLQGDESCIRKIAGKMARWSLRTSYASYVELSNEPWNDQQFTWGIAAQIGRDRYGETGENTGAVNAGISARTFSKLSTQAMRWVTEEFAAVGATRYLSRVFNAQNVNAYNTEVSIKSDPDWLTYHDEIQTAPYCGGGSAAKYPQTIADITPAMLDEWIAWLRDTEAPRVYGWAAANRDVATKYGRRFGTYEGFLEKLGNTNFKVLLMSDPVRWPMVVNIMVEAHRTRLGGLMRGYIDNGREFGFRPHRSFYPGNSQYPAPGLQAWLDAMAATPTI
jgi:hypothetical protein